MKRRFFSILLSVLIGIQGVAPAAAELDYEEEFLIEESGELSDELEDAEQPEEVLAGEVFATEEPEADLSEEASFEVESDDQSDDILTEEINSEETPQTPGQPTEEATIEDEADDLAADDFVQENAGADEELLSASDPMTDNQKRLTGEVHYYINPHYRDILTESDLKTPFSSDLLTGDSLSDEPAMVGAEDAPLFQDAASAGNYLRGKMKERKGTVQLKYNGDPYATDLWISDALENAYKHTGVPNEGDYLYFQMGGYSWSMVYFTTENGRDVFLITFAFTYYSTLDQEAYVTQTVRNIRNTLKIPASSEYETIRKVYDYVCKNVSYDNAHLNDNSYLLKFTAYAALKNRTAVCQGYALLIYRLLLESGIDCRIIGGYGSGGSHAWNIVRIGSLYYNMDATWDSSNLKYGYEYDWFLKGNNSTDFSLHEPDETYPSSFFVSEYPMSKKNYSVKQTMPQPKLIAAYNGAYGIGVKFIKVDTATDYVIYQKFNGVWKPIRTISANSPELQVEGNKLMYTDKTVAKIYGKGYIYSVEAKKGNSLASGYNKTGVAIYRLKPPAIATAVNSGAGIATVTWKSVFGKTETNGNYDLQIAEMVNGKAGTFNSVITKPGYKYNVLTARVTGLKKGKTYIFRIRCSKTNKDRGTFYSEYSPWKTVKITK